MMNLPIVFPSTVDNLSCKSGDVLNTFEWTTPECLHRYSKQWVVSNERAPKKSKTVTYTDTRITSPFTGLVKKINPLTNVTQMRNLPGSSRTFFSLILVSFFRKKYSLLS